MGDYARAEALGGLNADSTLNTSIVTTKFLEQHFANLVGGKTTSKGFKPSCNDETANYETAMSYKQYYQQQAVQYQSEDDYLRSYGGKVEVKPAGEGASDASE